MTSQRSVRGHRPATLVGLVVCALYLPGGCDLFATRTPAEGTGAEFLWLTPVTPQIVVENLRGAFVAGSFGDYGRTMWEDFVFLPDETDVSGLEVSRPGENVYDGWDRQVEGTVAEVIFGAAPSVGLELSLIREELIGEDTLLKYDYVLTLTPEGGDPVVYEGEAWFKVRQNLGNGEWLIFEWLDIASSDANRSWGFLKGMSRP